MKKEKVLADKSNFLKIALNYGNVSECVEKYGILIRDMDEWDTVWKNYNKVTTAESKVNKLRF